MDAAETIYGPTLMANPPLRAAVTAGAVSAVLFVAKPASMFTPDGKPRAWSVLDKSKDAVLMPWFVVAGALGFISIVFV